MNAREVLLEAFRTTCERVDLAGRVAAALGEDGPFVAIAIGKAATAMFAGVHRFTRALVVIPRGAPAPPADPRVRCMEASHPLSDASSVRAAQAALTLAASDAPGERLFLISGGASALVCAPTSGLTLVRKRAVVQKLLDADATIDEINIVRRHLSRIKGGGLARACGAEPRRTLLVSDVLSNAPHVIGSGPSVADPTKIDDARRIAVERGLGELPFVETWKHEERQTILFDPASFAELFAESLRALRVNARAITNPKRDMNESAQEYASLAKTMKPGEALVQAAEPVLRVASVHGRGGRCTHLATLVSTLCPEGTTFGAIATDGVDATSGTGGAIVDGLVPGAELALRRFDTGTLQIKAGNAIPCAPTGLNFADLHVLVRT